MNEFDGNISLGDGRKLEPKFNNEGQLISGTVFKDCLNSSDGYHHFTAAENIQSIEKFVCDFCTKFFYD
jgi:hypothetical protein